ncbi:MAG: ATP-dependent zinc metalloprotease FtsH [Fimbriimonadaceae bacterium]|nr:ATP-dependent zinc metalloprotease FtsH [Fimbriimonadaceae bacterium]
MNQRRPMVFWLFAVAFLVGGAWFVQERNQSRAELARDYSEFLGDLRQGKVQRVIVRDQGFVQYQTGGQEDRLLRTTGPTNIEQLNRDIAEHNKAPVGQLKLNYRPRSAGAELARQAAGALPIVAILVVLYVVFMRHVSAGNNQAMAFSRSRAKRLGDHLPRKTFDDVAGVGEAKDELLEIVDFLRHGERYRRLGAEIPKGVLLMGPPGCGKTLLARAVAGEAEVPFFHISGSDFVEMFVGVGASRVRDLFEQAKAHRPCIVFIDELDAVGRHRGAGLGGGHDEREQTVNQLLVEMDGFEPNNGIIVMAATNRPDILDPALLRPGRFDRRVVVDTPDVRGRQDILQLYIKAKPVEPDIDPVVLARQTPGLTGADLFSVCNEAGILAARLEKTKIGMEEFEEAIERVVSGRQRKSRVLLPGERRTVAYHEAGHAVIGHFHPRCEPVHKISILPRGMALGYVMSLPEEERHNRTLAELKAMMTQLLGGRLAEELVFGQDEITTGAQNDLQRVTELARAMVCEFGMSRELGPRTLGKRHGPVFLGREVVEDRDYSEELAHAIDIEIRRLVDEAHEAAGTMLRQQRAGMDRLVEVLLERETIGGSELTTVLGEAPPKVGAARDLAPAALAAEAEEAR